MLKALFAVLAAAALTLVAYRRRRRSSVPDEPQRTDPAAQLRPFSDADLEQISLARLRGGSFLLVNQELLSTLTHEIRASLNGVIGIADLLADSDPTPAQQRYIEMMNANGNGLLDLIDGIHDLVRAESGMLRLDEREFDLGELLTRLTETYTTRAREKELELVTRIDPEVPLDLIGDPLRLRQVLANLLGNAIKFTERGQVTLTVEKDPDAGAGWLHFTVADTGIGIPQEKQKEVLQTFAQADSSIGRTYGGSGLGLSIAKRLIELMGGRIRVESRRGVGTILHVTVQFVVAPTCEADSAAREPLEGLRVLVGDGNVADRSILKKILSRGGAEVFEADSGDLAIAEWRRARNARVPYHLAVLDERMPVMDGFEVARLLRSQSENDCPVVVLLSPANLASKLARLDEIGVDSHLVKPIRNSQMLQVLGAVAGKAREAAEKSASRPEQPRPPAARSTLRILVADDSPHNRLLVTGFLRALPCEVDTAENGEIALQKFTNGRYDLVLMDLRMPVMDGYAAVRRMRQSEEERGLAPVPMIALSASATEEDVRSSIEAGCTGHLSKPIRKSRLVAAVREATGSPAGSANGDDAKPQQPSAPITEEAVALPLLVARKPSPRTAPPAVIAAPDSLLKRPTSET